MTINFIFKQKRGRNEKIHYIDHSYIFSTRCFVVFFLIYYNNFGID